MIVSLVDVIVILMVMMGAIVGFKHGAIKEGTKFIGLFVVIVLSFILKDKLMVLMYENLPFFDFFGLIRGIDAINILFYQLVSFLIIFAAFMFVLKVLLVITGLIEWLLKMTIILSIPSKILGLFVGALEYYVYVFIVLYILNMPVFGLTFVSDSKIGMAMLEKTPVLSELVDDTVKVYSDVWNVIRNRGDLSNSQVNTYVLATLLDNKLITIESARKLVESNYITIDDNSILDKYNENESFFEKIGGCLLLGGCDGDSSFIERLYKTTIKNPGDSFLFENISFRVEYISANMCVAEENCNDDEKIEVGLKGSNGIRELERVVSTNGRYVWIVDTIRYVFAEIENGKLVVGIAEFNERKD